MKFRRSYSGVPIRPQRAGYDVSLERLSDFQGALGQEDKLLAADKGRNTKAASCLDSVQWDVDLYHG